VTSGTSRMAVSAAVRTLRRIDVSRVAFVSQCRWSEATASTVA